jgi:hypothetical protein
MPAQSKAQQRFMGMVHAVQKGDMEAPSKEVEKAADSMTNKDAKDYASTSHKGLPNKKENMKITKERLKELVKEVMTEESEYQAFFQKALDKAGKGINDMSDDEKKAFFNKIDAAWNGKGEKNEELTGDQHKLDVDGDGEIEASDLADLRAGKKVDENIASELPKASIPAAVSQRLKLAIDKIKDAKLNPTQKLQLIAQVVDSIGVDKSQLGTITNKIRSKMESIRTEAELPAATLPGAIQSKLMMAIDKIKDAKLTYNQKIQVIGKVMDSLGVDKGEFNKMSSKLKGTMESVNEARTVSNPIKVDSDTMVQIVGDGRQFRELTAAIDRKTGKPIQKFGFDRGNEIADSKEELIAKLQKKYGKSVKFESVNEGVKLSLVDPNTNKFIKTLSLDRTYREAEKEIETLNRRLSPSQKTKGLYWKVTSIGESVNEGKKVFKVNPGIGKAKYSISSHDGKKTHKDGSDFYDIEIFNNKVDLEKGIKKYTSNGFMKESVNEEIKVGQMVKVVDNPHWEAALGKKGPFKRKVKMIDGDNVFFTDGSNSSMKYIKESVESVSEGVSSAEMDKIKGAVEAAKSFMSVGAELKKLGMKYTFATEPLPIYIIQPTPNNRVAIVNKKYVSKPDFVVGDIAVGVMEGKSVNEGLWPKSKLPQSFQFALAPELKKNFKGIFYSIGDDIYHNDKKVLSVDGDRDSVNSIIAKLKKIVK